MSQCWYCGSKLIWMNDFNYDEVYLEGEGIVTYLVCSNEDCNAHVEFSISRPLPKNPEELKNLRFEVSIVVRSFESESIDEVEDYAQKLLFATRSVKEIEKIVNGHNN